MIIPKSDKPKAYLLGTNDTGYPGLGVEVAFTKFGVNKLDVEFFTRLGGSKLYFLESVDKIYDNSLTSLGRMGMKGLGNKILKISENIDEVQFSLMYKKLYNYMSDYLELLINGDEYTDDYFDDVLNEFMAVRYGNDWKFDDKAISFYELIGIKTKADFEHNYQDFLKEQK